MELEQNMTRVYVGEDVLSLARSRISVVFDNFKNVIVSVSGGKDSTTLYWLAVQEAQKRGRTVNAFFLDQEAEFQSSIDLMEQMMAHPVVKPLWYQVPLQMTNATSYEHPILDSWAEGAEWMRPKHFLAIHHIEEDYPKRFYRFFYWLESRMRDTAFLIGLRTEESLNRLRAVMQNPGWNSVLWSTRTRGQGTYRFYPIYDWSQSDVWKFISDNNLPYNRIYDKMLMAKKDSYKTMRVSNLIHEKSFRCLSDLQEYEPETFDKLVRRVPGVHVASVYAREEGVFDGNKLPRAFKTWLDYRNHLLETSPIMHKDKFTSMFDKQPKEEEMYRRQVRQLLLNDHENNLGIKPVRKKSIPDWWDIL